MTKKQIQKAWKELKLEIFQNRPNKELLLSAQVALAKIEYGKNVPFNTDLCQTIMSYYHKLAKKNTTLNLYLTNKKIRRSKNKLKVQL